MLYLNFKEFIEADENDPNKDKGDPLTALTTVVGIDPKNIADALKGGSYLLNKVINGKQYNTVIADIEPKMVGNTFVGAKFKVAPKNISQTTAVYIKNSRNKNARDPESGWIKPNETDDLIMGGFPSAAGGGAGPAPAISGGMS